MSIPPLMIGLSVYAIGTFIFLMIVLYLSSKRGRDVLQGETQRDREIDAHILTVNARVSIENDAEVRFAKAMEKLNDKEKATVQKKSDKFRKITGFIFPRRSDYLDHKSGIAEGILKKKCVLVATGEGER